MPPHAAQSLAIAAAFCAGGLFSLLAFDGIVYLLLGHTATVSHGMYRLGDSRPWVKWVWTGAGVGLVLFLRWHFWGE